MVPLIGLTAMACMFFVGQRDSAVAEKAVTDGIQELASQIPAIVKKTPKEKLAIFHFSDITGGPTHLSDYIPVSLTALLVDGGVSVVERSKLDDILKEQSLGQAGLMNTAVKIGKLAGANAIVTGAITKLPSGVEVNCSVSNVETGEIIGVAHVKLTYNDDLEALMRTSADGEKFVFERKGCLVAADSSTCAYLITNEAGDRQLYLCLGNKVSLAKHIETDSTLELSLVASRSDCLKSDVFSFPGREAIPFGISPKTGRAVNLNIEAQELPLVK
jgi:hypothetical protein